MNPTSQDARNSEFSDFLSSLGKTLSRVNLYPMTHPLVVESIQSSLTHLTNSLSQEKELTVAWTEGKLLLNGTPLSGLGTLQSVLGGLFEKYRLHSLTFKAGISLSEITSLCKLFTLKAELVKNIEEIKSFFEKEQIRHIQPNTAFFAKVTAKDKALPDPISSTPGVGPRKTEDQDAGQIISSMEQLPLESMLWQLIQMAVPNPEDQKKVFDLIFKQLQNDIESHVKKATQKLEKEKEVITHEQVRTQSVINQVADGQIVVDEAGRIIMMNLTAEKIYGETFSQLKGKPIGDLIKEELAVTIAKDLTHPQTQEQSKEVIVRSGEETHTIIKNSTATIQNPDGKIVGIMSILNDIAKQRELQRMQNDFMAHVTHELRSPLTAIKASLGSVSDEKDLNPQMKHILSIADRNIDRLARLINDLLDSTKIEACKMTVNPKTVNSVELLRDAVTSLQPWAQKKQISLKLDIPQTLPQVSADSDRMTQVIVNLVSNSIKFTPPNGTISVRGQPISSLFLKIVISDTGPGMPREKLNQLFQRFFQLQQKEKTDAPGTGLGLYISKSIVELHKGEIGVESEEGKGTTFYFTLPIVQETKPLPPAVTAAPLQVKKKKSFLSRLFGK